jgi:hypothetical protein
VSDEKPLHVQVAEALGWEHLRDDGGWRGDGPNWRDGGGVIGMVPRYDTDWAATGPLIEKHRLIVGPGWRKISDSLFGPPTQWVAKTATPNDPEQDYLDAIADTPLEAVCRLILDLKAAGKLEAA